MEPKRLETSRPYLLDKSQKFWNWCKVNMVKQWENVFINIANDITVCYTYLLCQQNIFCIRPWIDGR